MTPDDLRRWQMEMGYTQDQAAEALDTPIRTYKRWLSGINPNTGQPIKIDYVIDLACAALLLKLAPFSEKEKNDWLQGRHSPR